MMDPHKEYWDFFLGGFCMGTSTTSKGCNCGALLRDMMVCEDLGSEIRHSG
jgi:hypothetical protein